jgi:hypothetical protein
MGRKRPIGKPGRRWEVKIKMNLTYDGGWWIGLVWLRIEASDGLL